ncbi:hypothetical protein TrST_g9483 [Triparma strigata]|uniref:Major facilitator superfamily (MFS) profile domain-containing protein n=1 Tax=Triparma strigata TaxID=1606541 RepID=A0A9W7AUG1_9STRA|nr:hypothetical protein TrST_g9483 [Triparma strigata]
MRLPPSAPRAQAFRPSNSLVSLTTISAHSQTSRYLLPYLITFPSTPTSLNASIQLTSAEYGLLAGLGFTTLFCIGSLYFGSIIGDPKVRKSSTIAGTVLTSLLVLVLPLCDNFYDLVAVRLLTGLACSAISPAGYTWISDNCDKDEQEESNSFFSTSVYIGGGLASLAGGAATGVGWENVCYAVGGAGFGIAAAGSKYITDIEGEGDKAGVGNEDSGRLNIAEDIQEVLSDRTTRTIYLASLFRFSAGLTIGVWAATYFKGSYPDFVAEYSAINAVIVSVAGLISASLGGTISKRLRKFEEDNGRAFDGRMWVPAVGSALGGAVWLFVVGGGSFQASMALLTLEYLVAESWFGPTVSYLQSSTTKGGVAQGLFTVTAGLSNIAPGILGALVGTVMLGSDVPLQLQDGLGLGVSGCYVAAALLFWKAGTEQNKIL